LDGKPVANPCQFALDGVRRVAVLAAGEPGEQATVEVDTPGGVALVDVLLVTPHDPFPVSHYGFRAL
jgi:hypothetical protein